MNFDCHDICEYFCTPPILAHAFSSARTRATAAASAIAAWNAGRAERRWLCRCWARCSIAGPMILAFQAGHGAACLPHADKARHGHTPPTRARRPRGAPRHFSREYRYRSRHMRASQQAIAPISLYHAPWPRAMRTAWRDRAEISRLEAIRELAATSISAFHEAQLDAHSAAAISRAPWPHDRNIKRDT